MELLTFGTTVGQGISSPFQVYEEETGSFQAYRIAKFEVRIGGKLKFFQRVKVNALRNTLKFCVRDDFRGKERTEERSRIACNQRLKSGIEDIEDQVAARVYYRSQFFEGHTGIANVVQHGKVGETRVHFLRYRDIRRPVGYLTCGIVEEDDSVPHGMIANTFCCDPPHLRLGLEKVNLSAYGKQPGEIQPGAATKVHHHRTINLTGKIRPNGLSHDSIARICSDQTVIVRGDNVIIVGCSGHPCKVSPHK